MVNAALLLDAAEVFGYNQDEIGYAREVFDENNLADYKQVIKKLIKFLRLLNACIVDAGSEFNDRTTTAYCAVTRSLFQNLKEGEIARVATYMS